MADFDDKHPRDDKGRFTASGELGPSAALSAYAASRGPMKHDAHWGESAKTKSFKSGRRIDTHVAVKELKGYSKGEGTAGKVEGRAREVEIPLVRKSEGTIHSTGEVEVTGTFDVFGSAKKTLQERVRTRQSAVSHQVDVLEMDVKRAEVAEERARNRCLVGPGHNISSNDKGELVTLDGKPAEGQMKKLIEKAKKAGVDAEEKIREFAKATSISSALAHAWSPFNEFSKYVARGDKITLAHSADDGSLQWHIRRPDDSELSIDVEPALTKKDVDDLLEKRRRFGRPGRFDPNYPEAAYESRIRISTTYPHTKDDRANRPETEGLIGVGKKWEQSAEHIKEFFEAAHAHTPHEDEEYERFRKSHPNGTGIETMGGGKPGEIWKPGKKTLGDYQT